jgi:hypothetical protein
MIRLTTEETGSRIAAERARACVVNRNDHETEDYSACSAAGAADVHANAGTFTACARHGRLLERDGFDVEWHDEANAVDPNSEA